MTVKREKYPPREQERHRQRNIMTDTMRKDARRKKNKKGRASESKKRRICVIIQNESRSQC